MRVAKLRQSLQEYRRALEEKDEQQRLLKLREYYFPPGKNFFEYCLVFINWIAAFIQLVVILKKINGPIQLVLVLFTLPIVLFVADIMSAGFHKWLDSYASEDNPFWGSAARAFRIHHEFPNNLDEVSYLHNVVAFAKFMALQYVLFSIFMNFINLPGSICFMIWALIFLFSNGTEIHKQAHLRNPSRFWRYLQCSGIFLSRRRHSLHHRCPMDSDYGIINGWSNRLLCKFNIFVKLDNWVWRYTGCMPRNWIHNTKSMPTAVIDEFRLDPKKLPIDLLVYAEIFPEKICPPLRELLNPR